MTVVGTPTASASAATTAAARRRRVSINWAKKAAMSGGTVTSTIWPARQPTQIGSLESHTQ